MTAPRSGSLSSLTSDVAPAAAGSGRSAMTEDQAIEILKGRTSLEVHPEAIRSAVRSQPGDLEAAVKQVLDWFATGESRSKRAGVLLLAALRSQARAVPAQRKRYDGETERLIAALPGFDARQVHGAVVTIRQAKRLIAANPARYADLPKPSLAPEAVAAKVSQVYRHEAVTPQSDPEGAVAP